MKQIHIREIKHPAYSEIERYSKLLAGKINSSPAEAKLYILVMLFLYYNALQFPALEFFRFLLIDCGD